MMNKQNKTNHLLDFEAEIQDPTKRYWYVCRLSKYMFIKRITEFGQLDIYLVLFYLI